MNWLRSIYRRVCERIEGSADAMRRERLEIEAGQDDRAETDRLIAKADDLLDRKPPS